MGVVGVGCQWQVGMSSASSPKRENQGPPLLFLLQLPNVSCGGTLFSLQSCVLGLLMLPLLSARLQPRPIKAR